MEYPNSGALWPPKERKNDKMPNLRGSIKMEADLLQELINQSSDGVVEIEIAGWTKDYQGRKYLAIKGGIPYKKENKPAPQNDDSDVPFN